MTEFLLHLPTSSFVIVPRKSGLFTVILPQEQLPLFCKFILYTCTITDNFVEINRHLTELLHHLLVNSLDTNLRKSTLSTVQEKLPVLFTTTITDNFIKINKDARDEAFALLTNSFVVILRKSIFSTVKDKLRNLFCTFHNY